MALNLEKELKNALKRLDALEKRVVKLERKHETAQQFFTRQIDEAKKKASVAVLLAKRDALFEMRRELQKKAEETALLAKRDALFEMRRELKKNK